MLRLADLPADRDTALRSVTFKPPAEFFDLAKRYGINPTRLSYLLSRTLVAASPARITVSEDEGVAVESLK